MHGSDATGRFPLERGIRSEFGRNDGIAKVRFYELAASENSHKEQVTIRKMDGSEMSAIYAKSFLAGLVALFSRFSYCHSVSLRASLRSRPLLTLLKPAVGISPTVTLSTSP